MNGSYKTFGEAFKRPEKQGVKIIALDCKIEEDSMTVKKCGC